MSCGNHHDKDCSEVLERMFFFIDNEMADADCGEIEQHLEECGPCLQKYDLERTVKALVVIGAIILLLIIGFVLLLIYLLDKLLT